MNGRVRASSGTTAWRADATPAQLVRAADGLEQIAETCAGRHRDELLQMAGDLRDRAVARRAIDEQRRAPLRMLARF
jgi:hypothetical protein